MINSLLRVFCLLNQKKNTKVELISIKTNIEIILYEKLLQKTMVFNRLLSELLT